MPHQSQHSGAEEHVGDNDPRNSANAKFVRQLLQTLAERFIKLGRAMTENRSQAENTPNDHRGQRDHRPNGNSDQRNPGPGTIPQIAGLRIIGSRHEGVVERSRRRCLGITAVFLREAWETGRRRFIKSQNRR